jgi:hypothetical protein
MGMWSCKVLVVNSGDDCTTLYVTNASELYIKNG